MHAIEVPGPNCADCLMPELITAERVQPAGAARIPAQHRDTGPRRRIGSRSAPC
jgi:hypothetical protein